MRRRAGQRPRQSVAIQANTCTEVGPTTIRLAADTSSTCRLPSLAVNMWCAHSAKLITPTAMSAATTARQPASGVRASVGIIIETRPAAGRKMM